MIRNEQFLHIAGELTPELKKTRVTVAGLNKSYGKGDSEVFDFGNHYVGCVAVKLNYEGRHPDAPLFLQIAFCENKSEIDEIDDEYHGWISSSWIQKEVVHVDELPFVLKTNRRYAFRYVVIKVLDASPNYRAVIECISANTVTSADDTKLLPYNADGLEKKIDEVAVRTLRNCKQLVFEDGPKRDRRLWLGDLRLQALADYTTYRDYSLVKRCLYLFAGCALDNGQVASNMFITPQPECDDQAMFDYSLFFINTLNDYYVETKDLATVKDLFATAYRQYKLASACFDKNNVIRDSDRLGWCFVDWNLNLNKQASAQAIYIYALKALEKLCAAVGRPTDDISEEIRRKSAAALKHFYDKDCGVFVSGKDKQVSQASQIWMILAGVVSGEQAKKILLSNEFASGEKIVTPYMYHSLVEAHLSIGEKETAKKIMLDYWGKMIDFGADTFFELFDPEDPDASPYGGKAVNSYCHAWSCTPTYFLRRHFDK